MTSAYNRQIYGKEDMDKFLYFLRKLDGNIGKAARKARVKGGRQTIIRWREKFPWFDEEMEEILDQLFDDIESFVARKSKKNLTAARLMLLHHRKGRERGYGKRTELTGKDGAPLSWQRIVGKLSDDED